MCEGGERGRERGGYGGGEGRMSVCGPEDDIIRQISIHVSGFGPGVGVVGERGGVEGEGGRGGR